jgi:3-mercaptopyruvate sulfurtransferase SseA
MGFPNVAHFEPGFNGWSAAGLSVEGAPETPKKTG